MEICLAQQPVRYTLAFSLTPYEVGHLADMLYFCQPQTSIQGDIKTQLLELLKDESLKDTSPPKVVVVEED